MEVSPQASMEGVSPTPAAETPCSNTLTKEGACTAASASVQASTAIDDLEELEGSSADTECGGTPREGAARRDAASTAQAQPSRLNTDRQRSPQSPPCLEAHSPEDSSKNSDFEFAESPETTPKSSKFEVTEETLNRLLAAIPVEAISRQAELAVDSARMCSRVSKLCRDASVVGPCCWSQLLALAEQCLDIASHVRSAADVVGRRASQVPHELIPILNTVKQASSKLRKTVAGQVIKGAKDLLQATEHVSNLGADTLLQATKLGASTLQMRDAINGLAEVGMPSRSACEAVAELIDTVVRFVGCTAEAVGTTAFAVGDAQTTARNFIEVLEAAGVWANGMAQPEEEEEERQAKRNDETDKDNEESGSNGDRENGGEGKPWSCRVDRHRLLLQVNSDVLSLQQELRLVVSRSPSLIDAISGGQKHDLFALVAEVLESALAAVSRARRSLRVFPGDADSIPFLAAVEGALDFVFAAAAWGKVAAPSLEARLLRLASLLDCRLLREMLWEDLFRHVVTAVRGCAGGAAAASDLEKRFSAASVEIQVGLAGG